MNTNRSILLAGAFYIDTLVQLAEYPAENTKVPSLATEERRGGNSANSATVLAQFPNRRVFVVSSVGDIAKSQCYVNDLAGCNIDVEACVYRPGLSPPSAMVLISRKTNTRTIISYRKVPELTLGELQDAYRLTFEKAQSTIASSSKDTVEARTVDWVHIEGRNVPNIIAFAKWLRGLRDTSSMLPPRCISQEFESPTRVGLDAMLPLVDVALFSRLYAENYLPNTPNATTFLKHISKKCQPGALLFCTWGESGVYSCRVPQTASETMTDPQVIHTPARQFHETEVTVIDTVGAGDTFTAAVIHRLVSRLPSTATNDDHGIQWLGGGDNAMLAAALTGCNLAGRKVTQMGFESLAKAWMDLDAQIEATESFNQNVEKM